MIRNIIFDFGGVIAPIDRDRAVQAFIRLGLKDADSRLDKYHQTGIFQQLEEGTLTEQEFREILGQLCGRPLTFEEVKEAWMGFFSGVDERILTLLEELRHRYRLYVLSNTNPYVISWACSKQFSPAGKPLDAYFDKLYLSYEMGHTKPDERIFRHILSDAQLNAAETLLWMMEPRMYRWELTWVCIPFSLSTEATGDQSLQPCSRSWTKLSESFLFQNTRMRSVRRQGEKE